MGIFENFDSFLSGESDLTVNAQAKLSDREKQIFSSVLLIQILDSSGSADKGEAVSALARGVSSLFGISAEETGVLLETAQILADNEERLQLMLGKFNSACSNDEKLELFRCCCQIVAADRVVEAQELEQLNAVGALLNLTLEQQVLARQLAERK